MVLHGYNKQLCVVIERLGRTNRKLQLQVVKGLTEYKNSRRPATNKTQQTLYYRSIQHIRDNLVTDLGMQLINYRLGQFARYFSYMWNNPSLNITGSLWPYQLAARTLLAFSMLSARQGRAPTRSE